MIFFSDKRWRHNVVKVDENRFVVVGGDCREPATCQTTWIFSRQDPDRKKNYKYYVPITRVYISWTKAKSTSKGGQELCLGTNVLRYLSSGSQ